MAAPAYASQGAPYLNAGDTAGLGKPDDLAVGDLMLAVLNVSVGSAPTWTYPSGWAKADGTTWSSSSNKQLEVAWKIATSGDVAASTFEFVASGDSVEGILACILRVTGTHQTAPIDAHANQIVTSGSTGTFPGLTTTSPNDLVIHIGSQFYGTSPSGTEWPNVAPSGDTLFGGSDGSPVNVSLWSAGQVKATAGVVSAATVSAPAISAGNDFHSLTIAIAPPSSGTQTLTPSLFTNSPVFYAPTVTRGAITLTPSLLGNSPVFYGPTVSQGGAAQTLTPSLFTNNPAFFAPTVTPGAVSLHPGLVTNTPAFFGPTVTRGAVTLTPARFDSANTFYGPIVTLAGGAQSLTPSLFQNINAFFAPTVVLKLQVLKPDRLDNSNTFFSPAVALKLQVLRPSRFDNEPVFFPPAVSNDNAPPLPGGVYPLAVTGHPIVSGARLTGGASVTAGRIVSGATVITTELEGRI